jgi:hypothetical protein
VPLGGAGRDLASRSARLGVLRSAAAVGQQRREARAGHDRVGAGDGRVVELADDPVPVGLGERRDRLPLAPVGPEVGDRRGQFSLCCQVLDPGSRSAISGKCTMVGGNGCQVGGLEPRARQAPVR